jgi:hypothetical protein
MAKAMNTGINRRYSRKKRATGITLVKGNPYRRDEVIKNVSDLKDYKGISHYFIPTRNEIYSFFTKGQHKNKYEPPFFTFTVNNFLLLENLPKNEEEFKSRTRHVFYKGDSEEKDAKYKYLGTTGREATDGKKIIWAIK